MSVKTDSKGLTVVVDVGIAALPDTFLLKCKPKGLPSWHADLHCLSGHSRLQTSISMG